MPKISVIIPAFNEEKYIKSTIDAVLSSDYKDFEIIVVLDSCTDNTIGVLKKYKNIKFISINARKPSVARNSGAKLSKGDIFVFLDADTLIPSNLLSYLASGFSSYAIGTVKAKPDITTPMARLLLSAKDLLISSGLLKTSNGIIITTKDVFQKIGGFDESLPFHEDGVFVRNASKLGKFLFITDRAVTNSMRRYEIIGYTKSTWFWINEFFKGIVGKRSRIYPVAR